MAPTSRIASHTKFLLRSISISFWIVAIFAPFLKLLYAHEAAAQARFAQKVAYLVSFLFRREDSVTFCAKLQARLCRVSYLILYCYLPFDAFFLARHWPVREIGSIASPRAC